MKKILFITSIVLFLVSSCEGPQGPQGPAGRDGIANKDILDFEVIEWDEVVDNQGNFVQWEAYFGNVENLDDYVYNNAAIVAYSEVISNSHKIQKSLPIVNTYEDERGEDWIQTIDFDYSISSEGEGGILFTVRNSDFRDDYPGPMWFRVVFVW